MVEIMGWYITRVQTCTIICEIYSGKMKEGNAFAFPFFVVYLCFNYPIVVAPLIRSLP
jgi:hypothetical protein